MSGQLLDFPQYVERSEPIRHSQLQELAFDIEDDELERTIRDVIEELEYIRDTWRDRSRSENLEAVNEQIRRFSRN